MTTRNQGSQAGATRGGAGRRTFAKLARTVIEKHVPESRVAAAHWQEGVNDVWVRWPVDGGRHALLGLHRHMDWVTGEAGLALGAHALRDLAMIPAGSPSAAPVAERAGDSDADARAKGVRARLGVILEGDDRWWPAGTDRRALLERLEWIVLQLRAHAPRVLERRLASLAIAAVARRAG